MKSTTESTKSLSFEKAFLIVVALHVVGAIGLYGLSSIKGYFGKMQREKERQELAEQPQLSSPFWKDPVPMSKRVVTAVPKPNKPSPPKQTKKPTAVAKATPPPKPRPSAWSAFQYVPMVKSSSNGTKVSDFTKDVQAAYLKMVTKAKNDRIKKELQEREREQLATEKRLQMNRIRQALQFQNAEEERETMKILSEAYNNTVSREIVSSKVVLQ